MFLFLVFMPLVFTGCMSSGGGWVASNSPGYNGKAGPDGELVLDREAGRGDLKTEVASTKAIDHAPVYHHYDQAPARSYASARQSSSRKSTQYAGGSSDAHLKTGNHAASVSSETVPAVTQK